MANAELFQTYSDNISLHLKNIFAEDELNEKATTEYFSVVRQERQNLDKDKSDILDFDKLAASIIDSKKGQEY